MKNMTMIKGGFILKKHKIIKEAKKFFTVVLIATLIRWIGEAFGIDAFSYNEFTDGFNLQLFSINLIRFIIAYWIVYSLPGLIKKKKAIEVE